MSVYSHLHSTTKSFHSFKISHPTSLFASQSFSQPACLPTNPIRPTCISCRPPHHVRHTDSDGPTKSHAASPVGTVTLVICGVFVLRAVHNSLLSTTFSIRFLIFARVFFLIYFWCLPLLWQYVNNDVLAALSIVDFVFYSFLCVYFQRLLFLVSCSPLSTHIIALLLLSMISFLEDGSRFIY